MTNEIKPDGHRDDSDPPEDDQVRGFVSIAESPIVEDSLEQETAAEGQPPSDVSSPKFEFPLPPEGSSTGSSTAIVRYDPLQSYLSEIRHLPMLSREEEHELAVRYREGDKVAGYKLVLANLRLVVMVAREYQRNAQNILDLVQEGNIGLLEAVKKYDPFRGIRFPSYAVYWVRAYMLRYLINNIRLVKLGTTQAQRKLFFNLMKEKEKLEREGFVPEAKLLARRLNVKESEVLEMEQRLFLPDLSIDAPVGRSDDAATFHSLFPDSAESAEETVVREQFGEELRSAVEDFKKSADAKEILIIDKRLFTEDPVTLQVIADEFGVSRERIRQIESRLKGRLKTFLAQRLGLDDEGQISIEPMEDRGMS